MSSRYGSQGARSTLEITREGGTVLQAVARDPPINIRVTIPGTFPSQSPNVQPLPAISGSAAPITLSPPIRLDTNRKWQIVPYSLSIPYTTPNLGPASAAIPGFPSGNSRVTISIGGGASADLVLPAGLYGINDIAVALNIAAQAAGWIDNAVLGPLWQLTGDNATQQTIITADPTFLLANAGGSGNAAGSFPIGGITLNFTNPSPNTGLNDSMGQMIGFPTVGGGAVLVFGPGTNPAVSASFTSPNRADLARLSAIVIYTDIATSSYVDGISSNAIYTVPVGDKTPNTILSILPPFEQPVPVGQYLISSFKLWFTDQRGNFLPSFHEDCSVAFSVEETHG